MTRVSLTARGGLEALGEAAYSSLVTYKRDGSPVPTPVWQAVTDGRIYVFTEAASYKVKRLRRNPKVELAICDWRGAVTSPERWQGRAIVVDDPRTIARAYAALDRKYGWRKTIVDCMSKLSGRFEGRAMLEIELDSPLAATADNAPEA